MQAALPLQETARSRHDVGRSQDLVRVSFAVRSAAMEVLDAHHRQMEHSRRLVQQALALCARLDAVSLLRGPVDSVVPAPAAPPSAAEEQAHCMMSGCARGAQFRPCFVIERGIRRILVDDMPVRVCSEHRVDLDALLRRPAVLDKLRRKLRLRGGEEPDAVHVMFEVVN